MNDTIRLDRQAEDDYFSSIAAAIEDFAVSRNLLLEKYTHGMPTWSLYFTHPGGASALLGITHHTEDEVTVGFALWEDDFDSFTRRIYRGNLAYVPKKSDRVLETLEQAFSASLQIERGAWTQEVTGFRDSWRVYPSKEEFEAFAPRYPKPYISQAPE